MNLLKAVSILTIAILCLLPLAVITGCTGPPNGADSAGAGSDSGSDSGSEPDSDSGSEPDGDGGSEPEVDGATSETSETATSEVEGASLDDDSSNTTN